MSKKTDIIVYRFSNMETLLYIFLEPGNVFPFILGTLIGKGLVSLLGFGSRSQESLAFLGMYPLRKMH